MDPSLILLTKVTKGDPVTFYEIMLFCCVLPLLVKLISQITDIYLKSVFKILKNITIIQKICAIINRIIIYKCYNTVEIIYTTDNDYFVYKYYSKVFAISWYILAKKLAKYENYIYTYDTLTLKSADNLNMGSDMYLDAEYYECEKQSNVNGTIRKDKTLYIKYIIKSNRALSEIQNYIDEIEKKYIEYKNNKIKGNRYHFVISSKDDTKLLGGANDKDTKRLEDANISDKNQDNNTKEGKLANLTYRSSCIFSEKIKNYQTFDTLFIPHNKRIMDDMSRLMDDDYNKRWGGKSKLGYLFYGPPGCGKTAIVAAMSNYGHRHIIEVPWARLKTIEDLELIISLRMIGDISFIPSETILLFDELDKSFNAIDEFNIDKKTVMIEPVIGAEDILLETLLNKPVSKKPRPLNLGDILSTLDGVGNYNGLIIIATANDISKIPPVFYRDSRMTLIKIDYIAREEAKQMVMHFLGVGPNEPELAELLDEIDCGWLSGASLKIALEQCGGDLRMACQTIKEKHYAQTVASEPCTVQKSPSISETQSIE